MTPAAVGGAEGARQHPNPEPAQGFSVLWGWGGSAISWGAQRAGIWGGMTPAPIHCCVRSLRSCSLGAQAPQLGEQAEGTWASVPSLQALLSLADPTAGVGQPAAAASVKPPL